MVMLTEAQSGLKRVCHESGILAETGEYQIVMLYTSWAEVKSRLSFLADHHLV